MRRILWLVPLIVFALVIGVYLAMSNEPSFWVGLLLGALAPVADVLAAVWLSEHN